MKLGRAGEETLLRTDNVNQDANQAPGWAGGLGSKPDYSVALRKCAGGLQRRSEKYDDRCSCPLMALSWVSQMGRWNIEHGARRIRRTERLASEKATVRKGS